MIDDLKMLRKAHRKKKLKASCDIYTDKQFTSSRHAKIYQTIKDVFIAWEKQISRHIKKECERTQ
jgi:hypothetical protein